MSHTTFTVFFFAVFLSVYASNDAFLVMRGAPAHGLSSLNEQYVADLISHVNGLPPVNQQVNRDHFPQTNLFASPSVNVLLAIDSITPELLNKANTKFLNIENDQSVEIIKAAYPEDSLTTLTTILTGEDHATHGINGHSWKASRDVSVEAYSSNGNCLSPKIGDQIAVSSQGQARVISVSGSKQMASALGVHSELMEQHPEWNAQSLYFSRQRGLVNLFTDITVQNFNSIGAEAKSRQMTLKTLEGHILATELSAIRAIPARLAAMERGEDVSVPDFVGIGIYSIRALTVKYGTSSEQVMEALRLLDVELSNMFAELEEMYNGDIVSEIVGLQSTTSEHTFYTQRKQQMRLVAEDNPGNEPDDGTTYTTDEVTAFQTKFWVAISLIIAVTLGIIALVKMDMLENSLIYRTTDGPRPIPNVS